MSKSDKTLNCSTSTPTPFPGESVTKDIKDCVEEVMLEMDEHYCEDPFKCSTCLAMCYSVFLTALDLEQYVGSERAKSYVNFTARAMGDRCAAAVLKKTLSSQWSKMVTLCRKHLLRDFDVGDSNVPTVLEHTLKDNQQFYSKFETSVDPRDVIPWNIFIGKQCPKGFNELKKNFYYTSIAKDAFVNYNGVKLDNIQPVVRPKIPARWASSTFDFLMEAQTEWNMTRNALSSFAENAQSFERWVRMHGRVPREMTRFVSIHKECPNKFIAQSRKVNLSPVARKFLNSVQEIIVTDKKTQRNYDIQRRNKYDVPNEFEAQVDLLGLYAVSESLNTASRRFGETTSAIFDFNRQFERIANVVARDPDTSAAAQILGVLHFIATLITHINPLASLTGVPLAIHIASVVTWWATKPDLTGIFAPLVALIKGCGRTAMEGQSANDSGEIETITQCFKEYFLSAFGLCANSKLNESRAKRIDLLYKTTWTAAKIGTMIWKAITAALTWFLDQTGMVDIKTLEQRVTGFCIAADTFDLDENETTQYRKIETRQDMKDLCNLVAQGRRLYREASVVNGRLAATVTRSLSRIETKFRQIRAYHFKETGAEMKPVAVWIVGKAGTGKTMLMDQFMCDVFQVLGREYDDTYHKFVISKESEYYDGLMGQPVLVLDDVFVVNDANSDNMDVARIVSLTDGSAKHVNMADCDLKSCTYATPEFVLMTSNSTPSADDLIYKMRDPNALMRRMDLIVHTQNAPGQGFADQQFQLKKFQFPPEGSLSQLGNYVPIPGKTSYYDLVQEVAQMYMEHKHNPVSKIGRLSKADIDTIRSNLTITPTAPPACQMEGQVDNVPVGDDYVEVEPGIWAREYTTPGASGEPIVWRTHLYEPPPSTSSAPCLPNYAENMRADGAHHILPGETWKERAYRYYCRVRGKVEPYPICIGTLRFCEDAVSLAKTAAPFMTFGIVGKFILFSVCLTMIKYAVTSVVSFIGSTAMAVTSYCVEAVGKMAQKVGSLAMRNVTYARNDIIEEGEKLTTHCHECEVCGAQVRHTARLELCVTQTHICTTCELPEAQSAPESKTFVGAKTRVVRSPRARQFKGQGGKFVPKEISDQFSTHSASDAAMVETFYATSRNYITVRREDRGISTQGFVLTGNIACTVGHFFSDIEAGDKVELLVDTIPISNVKLELTYEDIYFAPEADLACFRLPRSVAPFRSIVHHFVDEDPVASAAVLMPKLVIEGNRCVITEKLCSNYRAQKNMKYTYDGLEISTDACGAYDYPTEKGDCGNLIYLVDSTRARKIVGYHIAGNGRIGICRVLTRGEALDIVQVMQEVHPSLYSTAPIIDEEDEFDDMEGHVLSAPKPIWPGMGYHPIGTSEDNLVGSGKSQFVPSKIHGLAYPVTHKPAKLRTFKREDGERVDPLHRCEVTPAENCVDEEIMESIVDNMLDNVHMYPDKTNTPRLLTLEEAINGVDIEGGGLHPWIGAMEMKTSAGKPFITRKREKKGKLDLFEFTNGKYHMREELRKEYLKLRASITCATEEPTTWPVFTDVKKDELLIAAKADAGRTRIFNVGPVHFNIICREYFGIFNAHIMANHNDGEVKVGLNVHSDEWRIFYERLIRYGDPDDVRFLAGDWSGWDKSLPYQFCMAYIYLADKWYNDGRTRERVRIGQMMFSSFRHNGDQLYRVYGSLPSGIIMTAVGNSIINMALSRYVFLKCVEEHLQDWRLWAKIFQENVRCGFYGDDAIYTVTRAYANMFNMHKIAQYGATVGMQYTSPDKSSELPIVMSEKDVTFIKRKFIHYEGLVLAPLEWVSLCNMLNWRRSDMEATEALRATFNSFQVEMLHYGHIQYTEQVNHVRRVILEKGVWVEYKDWSRLFSEVWGHFATLSYVDKDTRVVNILDAAVDANIHHVREIRRKPSGKTEYVDWCPSYLSDISKQPGGKKLAHHVCSACKKIVLAVFDDSAKCLQACCLECLGCHVPQWYFHRECPECAGGLPQCKFYIVST
jgi:hypothetical protein